MTRGNHETRIKRRDAPTSPPLLSLSNVLSEGYLSVSLIIINKKESMEDVDLTATYFLTTRERDRERERDQTETKKPFLLYIYNLIN